MNRDEINEFDPVKFSTEENLWLIDNIDKPAIVALRDVRPGVNPKQVKPLLDRLQELEELQRHTQIKWVGFERLKQASKIYIEQDAKWLAASKRFRDAPRFPSLYSFDGKGRPHLGGPGSDAGQVRTYFDENGDRQKFAVPLIGYEDNLTTWAPPNVAKVTKPELFEDAETNRFECRVPTANGICGHTESYKADSRASRAAARARISKHLRTAKEETSLHRELYTNEFGG